MDSSYTSTTNQTAVNYRPDIDGLRAIAVLAVVIFHAVPVLLRGGFVGVDIFFVISGYLISNIILNNLEKKQFKFSLFYARRIRRIFPALILVLVVSYVLGWFFLLADEYKQLGKHIAGGASFISNFLLWRESGYFDTSASLKPLLHLWSLGIEEQFYLIWPLILYFVWKKRVNTSILLLAVVLLFLSFIINITLIHTNPTAVFYLPLTRFWELLLGSLLAYISLQKSRYLCQSTPWLANVLGVVGLTLITGSCFKLNDSFAFPGWWALLPVIGAVLLIAVGPHAWINRKLLSHPIVVWFGLISYPLYLWHWPVLYFSSILVPITSSAHYRIIPVLVSIVLAAITYTLIEKPIRFGKFNNVKLTGILFCMLSMIGVVGYVTYAHNGLGFRQKLPPFIEELVHTEFDMSALFREHKCMLAPNEDSTKFSLDCVDQNKRPLLFVWGDSYAGSLYQGLRTLQEKKNFGLAQYTASACPPLITYSDPTGRPFCKSINEHNLNQIKNLKPEVVLIHARWRDPRYKVAKLSDTISELKKIGIKNIVILGPVPEWADTLPHDIIAYWRHNHSAMPPRHMRLGLREGLAELDEDMHIMADKLGVKYISAYTVMCNKHGCLSRVGKTATDITAIDNGHLSPQGSRFLVKSIAKKLFLNESATKWSSLNT